MNSVYSTFHSELQLTHRIDFIVTSILVSVNILQYLISDLTFFTILLFVLTILTSAILFLSPWYSVTAYRALRLSSPLNSINGATILVCELENNILSVQTLLFREDGVSGKLIPRFEHEKKIFEAKDIDFSVSNKIEFFLVRCPSNLPISTYLNRLTEKDTRNASRLLEYHGENKFDIPLPDVKKLVMEQMQSPFFLFQVFCVLLWMLDEYWYFALFTLMMLIMFEFVVAQNRKRNVEVARQMLRPASTVWVKRAGSWRRVSSWELVPLDVIGVTIDPDNPFPCDVLLVRGSCVVNEAMLTGESTPKIKDSVLAIEDVNISLPIQTSLEDSRFILLGGTFVLDARKVTEMEKDVPEIIHSIGVVLRTGYETTQGSLMRVILHAGERVTVDSNREAYSFMLCLVVIATFAAGYVLMEGLKDTERSQWKLFLHCIMIVTSVVPPELPMELSLAVTTSLSNLIQKYSVYCTEPYRIPFAGKIDICCFDKTGTLTSDDLNVKLVVDSKQQDLSKNTRVLEILALCQSLVEVNKQVMGDTTETAAWRFLKGCFQVLPSTSGEVGINDLSYNGKEYHILKRFPFDSNLRRMSVIVKMDGKYLALCKGAPETLQSLLKTVPSGFTETYEELSQKGFRVLCLSSKEVLNPHISRAETESSLEFQGLLALDSPLKADSEFVVNELRKSGHRVIIITGDNGATAAEVGRRLNISEGSSITGSEFGALTKEEKLNKIQTCSVFARVSPAQKENIISLLSESGLVTMMCGDGTNDAGALKRADVGVSVVSHPMLERIARGEETSSSLEDYLNAETVQMQLGDASIASPFTAKTPHLSAILDIVRQGRCTLVTTTQMFKILAVNGLLHSFMMTVLFLQGVRQGDSQSAIFGVMVAVVFALLSFTQAETQLTSRRPVSKIFSLPVIASILGQSVIHLIALFSITSLAPVSNVRIDPDAPFKPNIINTLVYISGFVLQANVFAVNYRGYPFMTSFFDNKRFSRMIFLMWACACLLSFGPPQFLLDMFELVETPELNSQLILILFIDTVVSFAYEIILIRGVFGG